MAKVPDYCGRCGEDRSYKVPTFHTATGRKVAFCSGVCYVLSWVHVRRHSSIINPNEKNWEPTLETLPFSSKVYHL